MIDAKFLFDELLEHFKNAFGAEDVGAAQSNLESQEYDMTIDHNDTFEGQFGTIRDDIAGLMHVLLGEKITRAKDKNDDTWVFLSKEIAVILDGGPEEDDWHNDFYITVRPRHSDDLKEAKKPNETFHTSYVKEVYAEILAFLKETYDELDVWVPQNMMSPTVAVKCMAVSPKSDGSGAVRKLAEQLKGLLVTATGEHVDKSTFINMVTLTSQHVEIHLKEDVGQKPKASHVELYVYVKIVPNWKNETIQSEARVDVWPHLTEAWSEFVAQLKETFGADNVDQSRFSNRGLSVTGTNIPPNELAVILKGLLYVTSGEKARIVAPHGWKKWGFLNLTWTIRSKDMQVKFHTTRDATGTSAYTIMMDPLLR